MNVFDVSVVTDVCPRINLQDEEAVTPSRAHSFTFLRWKDVIPQQKSSIRIWIQLSLPYYSWTAADVIIGTHSCHPLWNPSWLKNKSYQIYCIYDGYLGNKQLISYHFPECLTAFFTPIIFCEENKTNHDLITCVFHPCMTRATQICFFMELVYLKIYPRIKFLIRLYSPLPITWTLAKLEPKSISPGFPQKHITP